MINKSLLRCCEYTRRPSSFPRFCTHLQPMPGALSSDQITSQIYSTADLDRVEVCANRIVVQYSFSYICTTTAHIPNRAANDVRIYV